MTKRTSATLTKGPVGATLVSLALPMVLGMFSVIAFNLADTYFVAQLGTDQLAAISFTFPVIMVVAGVAIGLGTGTASVVARAIGEGEDSTIKRLASDSLSLSLLVVMFFSALGSLTIDPVFGMLGARGDILRLVREYMTIWYIGMVFLVIPMVGNSVIRATGDTKYPSLIMMFAAAVNIVLDPLLIFGLAGFPQLGLKGAAIATVIARALTCVASLAILHFRERILNYAFPNLRDVFHSWKRITSIGIPASVTQVIVPLSLAVVTRIAADIGRETVAALGAGTRVTAFALIPIFALSTSVVPFIGQNLGAGKTDRIDRARIYSNQFSLGWGIVCVSVLWVIARFIARLFSDDQVVVSQITTYLLVIPLGYSMQSISILTASSLNALGKPLTSTGIMVLRLFFLYVPFAYLGARLAGVIGLFGGIALAEILSGTVAWFWLRRLCRLGCT